jgi:hypothetical protein
VGPLEDMLPQRVDQLYLVYICAVGLAPDCSTRVGAHICTPAEDF